MKSWSNVPPKSLACIEFLYKVGNKTGRLWYFTHSRGIEFNSFTAWTISMKFSTFVQHVPGYKRCLRFCNVSPGTYLRSFTVEKRGKSSVYFERLQLSPPAKLQILRPLFVDLRILALSLMPLNAVHVAGQGTGSKNKHLVKSRGVRFYLETGLVCTVWCALSLELPLMQSSCSHFDCLALLFLFCMHWGCSEFHCDASGEFCLASVWVLSLSA